MSERTKIFVYNHTHWDREWYRSFQQFRFRLIEVIDCILDQFDKNMLEYFTLDGQSIVIEDYLEVKPQNKDRLIHYIKEGKLDIGPWLVLPDEFLVSGESIVKNLLLGHKLSNKYGHTNKVGYIPDTFGHSIDIPMILNKFDINNAILWRGVKTQNNEFKWYSMDMSYIKVYHLLKGYYTDIFDIGKNYSLKEKIDLLKVLIKEIKAKTTLENILIPIGGDHRPPPININKQIEEINNAQLDFELVQTTLSKFLNQLNADKLEETIQAELRDCSETYILPAVYSSRLYLKQNNAQLTNKINNIIEPLAVYCNLLKLDNFQLPDCEYLWKLLILNHPHDSICGCSIDEVHEEMEQRYKELHQACNEFINRGKFAIMKNLPKGKVAVFNTSNYPYTGVVELDRINHLEDELTKQTICEFEGLNFRYFSNITTELPATIFKKQTKELLWAENVPPHSIKILEPSKITNPVREKNGTLSNGLIEIQVNTDSITVKDLQNNVEYPNLNKLIDRLDSGDSYNFGPVKGYKAVKAKITHHSIKENGPLRGIIEIKYEINIPESLNKDRKTPSNRLVNHIINCEVSIVANSKLVEFNLSWYNKSKDHILQAQFPMENDIYSTLVENHFCTIERRFDPYYNIYKNIPASKLTELKVNTAPMQRFVQANDLALFTEGLPEYEVYKNSLYLTILRSTGYLSRGDVPTRGTQAGPELPIPGNQSIRLNTARYALHPKTTTPELYLLAERFMGCTLAIEGEDTGNSNINIEQRLLEWNNPNIISTSFSFNSESKSTILHLLNISRYPQQIKLVSDLKIGSIAETNFLNEVINTKTDNNTIIFRPNELKGFLVKFKSGAQQA